MAFDAGMLAAVVAEVGAWGVGARVEKVYQPRGDEIVLALRSREGSRRLLLRCGASDARIGFTDTVRDNPATPPPLCMLLRKHIGGAVLTGVRQDGFERVAIFEFAARDEMGFSCTRVLIAEVMGKNSNLIFTDGEGRIISALRIVDITTSRLRRVLPGMKYEAPPLQDGKKDPRSESGEDFARECRGAGDMSAAKFINSRYYGISPLIAREIAYRASGDVATPVSAISTGALYSEFRAVFDAIEAGRFVPVYAEVAGAAEYSFYPLLQYGEGACHVADSFASLLDSYFEKKDRAALVTSRAADLQRVISSGLARIDRKLASQESELAECEKSAELKYRADLITANIYRLKRGDARVLLTDYGRQNDYGSFASVALELDTRLSPSENAQKLYKKYAKLCTAREILGEQMRIAKRDREYLLSVSDSLSRAENFADFAQIRQELEDAGYVRAGKQKQMRSSKSLPLRYITTHGYEVLCGKNNVQNDELTFRRAERWEWWFHAKGVPGSHVILRTDGEEPPAEDMTEAAEIAAFNSKADGGDNVAVDYTEVRNVKKPPASRPGFVTYATNYTAYVTPRPERIDDMRRKAETSAHGGEKR